MCYKCYDYCFLGAQRQRQKHSDKLPDAGGERADVLGERHIARPQRHGARRGGIPLPLAGAIPPVDS